MITGGVQFYAGKLFVPVASKEVITALLEFGKMCCKATDSCKCWILIPVRFSGPTTPARTLPWTRKRSAMPPTG